MMRRKEVLENEMQLTLPSHSQNEQLARCAVSAFLAQADPTLEELADLRTVVSEAVTNCIVHAYPQTLGQIYIRAKILAGRRIQLSVRDEGIGIADLARAMTPLYTGDPEGERGGMGFTIMENFTDRLHVRSKVGSGTTVVMYKTLGGGAKSE